MKAYPQVPIQWTLAPFSDMDTSLESAKSIEPHIQRLERVVLDALEHGGAMTAEELEDATGLSGNTLRPRLCALRGRGLVVKTDEKRRTLSGRNAVVWRKP